VQDISPIKGLTQLQSLSLANTQVQDISPIKGLTQLQSLSLANTQVQDISPIKGLTQLHSLSLNSTTVVDLQPLKGLAQLKELYLDGTKVADLQPLKGLTRLKALHLHNTQVADLQPLKGLAQLKQLLLDDTSVEDLQPLKGLIEQGIEVNLSAYGGIMLQNCPLTNPPIEIARQGNKAILKYWEEQSAQGTVPIFEAKLLIVGDPSSGKTSLYRRMFRKDLPLPEADEKTRGIDIHRFDYDLPDGNQMRFNVWNFGGQQIYHATHQFFLTKRSIYVLLDDTQKSHSKVHDEYFKYWLGLLELYGGQSPVLIFQNMKGGRFKQIDLMAIRERFPQVIGSYAGNLLVEHSADALLVAIKEAAQQLEHVGTPWPKKWLEIRNALEVLAATKPYIEEKDYFELYKTHSAFKEEDALQLSQWLHDLGALLHFQDEPMLKRLLILQSTWATDAVYKILDDERCQGAIGKV
jgi:internalin A